MRNSKNTLPWGALMFWGGAVGVAGLFAWNKRRHKKAVKAPDNAALPSFDATDLARPRIVILGGGFGGLYTARHLESELKNGLDAEIVLVSRANYLLMPPLMFEVGSGVLEMHSAVNPIRPLLQKTRFVEAEVETINLADNCVLTRTAQGESRTLVYDHLVVALGGVTNNAIIPGAREHGLTYKSLIDAVVLRNQVIALFEAAALQRDAEKRAAMLRFVVVGGGLVGTELMGELSEFVEKLAAAYPEISQDELRFDLIHSRERLIPEMDEGAGDHAAKVLQNRGVEIHFGTRVEKMEAGVAHLQSGAQIEAATILVATGVRATPIIEDLPVQKNRNGRILTDATLRAHEQPNLWALGDCAAVPMPDGQGTYPPLAQHALRQAKVAARNLGATIKGEGELEDFTYEALGILASLGRFEGVARLMGVPLRGLPAWIVWRVYYVMQMPQWSRRLRIGADRLLNAIFKVDLVKIDFAGEETLLKKLRELPDPAQLREETLAATSSHGEAQDSEAQDEAAEETAVSVRAV